MDNKIKYYWIQKCDYSSVYKEVTSLKQAINEFKNYKWNEEIEKYDENNSSLNCPPGFGLHNGIEDGSKFTKLLHICPIDDKQILVHLHYSVESTLLGLIKIKKKKLSSKQGISYKNVSKIIEYFYDDNFTAIIEM